MPLSVSMVVQVPRMFVSAGACKNVYSLFIAMRDSGSYGSTFGLRSAKPAANGRLDEGCVDKGVDLLEDRKVWTSNGSLGDLDLSLSFIMNGKVILKYSAATR